MNNEEFDLYEFARLFDAALASNNPSVKKALRNFMLVASIVEAENEDNSPGPLQTVLEEVRGLKQRTSKIERVLTDQKAAVKDYRYGYDAYKYGYFDESMWRGVSTERDSNVEINSAEAIKRMLGKGKI